MKLVHVLNRGVEKRKIFENNQDYFRFVHDLFEFNNIEPADISSYLFRRGSISNAGRSKAGRPKIERKPRKLLVKIHAFCLMPNHYHMLVSPAVENGISLFMKKINGGYAKYFNEKYERSGALFAGKYKRVQIKSDAHFIHIPYYIHLNPLDLVVPEWRERKLNNYKKAMEFLGGYRWSSHMDYCGIKNFPSVTDRKLLLDFFDGTEKYRESIAKWIKEMDTTSFEDVLLE